MYIPVLAQATACPRGAYAHSTCFLMTKLYNLPECRVFSAPGRVVNHWNGACFRILLGFVRTEKKRLSKKGVIPYLPSEAAAQAGLIRDLLSLIKAGDTSLSLSGDRCPA